MSTRLQRPANARATVFGSTRPARAAVRFGDASAAAPPIVDTGMRGFLKWARQQYPAAVYQQIAAGVQQQIPQAFSGYMLGGWRNTAQLAGFADSSGTATVDTADAANSTPIDPSWVNAISQIVGTATGAYLDVAQQQNQNAILNAQLTAIQNGRAPLPISLGANGVTFSATAAGQTSITTILIWGGIAYVVAKATKLIK